MTAASAPPRHADLAGCGAGRRVVWPHALRDDDPAGGKAFGLLGLVRGGLPVPDFFVVLPHAFAPAAKAAAGGGMDHAEGAATLADSVLEDLRDALRRLCPAGECVAVRSSAADEDGKARSYAGQCDTMLSVRPEDVPAALVRVWLSGFATRITAYRRKVGHDEPSAGPAVIVQRQVAARASGIAFSADPVSGRRGLAVVAAVRGLGEGLVSGRSDGDTWSIDRRDVVTPLRRDDPAAPPVLGVAEVRRVARLAREAERIYRHPQDIEWAFVEDRLYCLQSRPITTLRGLPDPDAPLAVWDCRNISENYGGVTTPLTFTFVRSIYETAYRASARDAGIAPRRIDAHARAFKGMIGLVRGRIYYDLAQWRGLLALLPGQAWNWPFLAHMIGVPEDMPGPTADGAGRGWLDALRLARVAARIAWRSARLRRDIALFQASMEDEIQTLGADLASLGPDELAARYRRLMQRVAEVASVPTLNDLWVMILAGASRAMAERWLGAEAPAISAEGLALEGESISSRIGGSLADLARLAGHDERLLGVLAGEPAWSIEELAAEFPEFGAALARHVALYGTRVPGELKLETRTLSDDPQPLYKAVVRQSGATTGKAGSPPSVREATTGGRRQAAGAARATSRVNLSLAGHPVRASALEWMLARARGRLHDREALRFMRARIFGLARGILMALGDRFWALGVLENPRDILYLEVEEALAFVEGQASTTDLRGLTAFRRAEFEAFRAMPDPPVRFVTHGSPYLQQALSLQPPPAELGETRAGLACSPGRVTGRVRIVDPPAAAGFDPGDVVVARRTDPGWVTLLPACGGLAVEVGNPLSHAAIIARELGLPMVAALPGLSEWLRDGDLVEIDGAIGTVTRLQAA